MNRTDLVYRIVQFHLVLALVWKWEFFGGAWKVYRWIPLQSDFFPALFQSDRTLAVSFVAAVAAAILGTLFRHHIPRHVACAALLVGLTMLCLHLGSYNDATFTTAWWTSLWSWWFVSRMGRDDEDELLRKGAFLSRCIVSLVFLGGAAGKWTPEYWSGEVLHEVYFAGRDFWTFNALRDRYDPETLRTIATHYSRVVTVTETILGLGLWLMPPRISAVIAIAVLTSIAVLNNHLLFSVLLSLIGLASVGLFVKEKDSAKIHPQGPTR